MKEQRLYPLPLGWKWESLGDVVKLLNGRAYKKNELLDRGKTPVLRVGNFFSNRSWYYSDLELPADKYCNNGDLLYAWSASFGPKIWDGDKAIYHYHIWKIVTSEYVNKYYLYFLLVLDSEKIKASGNGIGMMHATKGGMEKRKIPLPPLAEQQKIAAILDAADALRQKDQQLIDHYTSLSQSLFLDMFGDPLTWMSTKHHKDWERNKIKDICLLKRGYDLPVQSRVEGDINIYAANGIVGKHNSFKVKGPGVITGRSGTLGKVIISEEKFWPLNTSLYVTNFNRNEPVYIAWFLRFFRLERYHRGAGVPTLNRNLFLNELSFTPPKSLQNEFVQRIEVIERQKQQAEANLEKSNDLFNSLLQRAFKGELTKEVDSVE